MNHVPDHEAGAGAVAQKPAAQKAPDEDHDQRYCRGLRHQPHDLLLSLQGYLRSGGWACLEDARAALEEKKTYATWQEGFLQIFEAVRANKPFIMNVYLDERLNCIQTWLALLTEDEAYVVKRHLIDGIDIPRTSRYFADKEVLNS